MKLFNIWIISFIVAFSISLLAMGASAQTTNNKVKMSPNQIAYMFAGSNDVFMTKCDFMLEHQQASQTKFLNTVAEAVAKRRAPPSVSVLYIQGIQIASKMLLEVKGQPIEDQCEHIRANFPSLYKIIGEEQT